ncbi:MAG: hypothetical protein L0154_13750 [Chloroflexi bacterium]|nr:hypothetical protein [Chloroflexota bacterium]
MDRAIFEDIRRQLRSHYVLDIIRMCSFISRNSDKHGWIGGSQYPEFMLLLLLKWSVIYSETIRTPSNRNLGSDEFNRLINRLNDLWATNDVDKYQHGFLWIRSLAFQQFWAQLDPNITLPGLARQVLLFDDLPKNHTFNQTFTAEFGISINAFIELALALATGIFTKPEMEYVEFGLFSNMETHYGRGTIMQFLDILSLDLTKSRRRLMKSHNKGRKLDREFYEQSLLKDYPLLHTEDRYICYTPKLLYFSLTSYLYDALKQRDGQTFMNKFGSIFENYVRKCIEYSGVKFLDEDQLKSEFGNNTKVVDFLISDGDSNIYIDAKAVEMSDSGMVIFSSDVIKHKTKDSVIKGIKQGYSIGNLIDANKRIGDLTLGDQNFLLVVTYKQLYLGNGSDFKNLLPQTEIDNLLAEYGGREIVPFSHIYFLSIEEFEWLMECTTRFHISDILKYAVQQDKTGPKSFTFGNYLEEFCSTNIMPKFLRDEFGAIYQRLMDVLKDT